MQRPSGDLSASGSGEEPQDASLLPSQGQAAGRRAPGLEDFEGFARKDSLGAPPPEPGAPQPFDPGVQLGGWPSYPQEIQGPNPEGRSGFHPLAVGYCRPRPFIRRKGGEEVRGQDEEIEGTEPRVPEIAAIRLLPRLDAESMGSVPLGVDKKRPSPGHEEDRFQYRA